jgi:hypothetical protein
MVTPAAKRKAVAHLQSSRRLNRLTGQPIGLDVLFIIIIHYD